MNMSTAFSRKVLAFILAIILAVGFLPAFAATAQADESTDVNAIVASMTLDEKISQMIIPAIRTWDGNNVTDLSDVSDLSAALRAHQYGGVILFGQNVADTEQTARLVSDLQENNAQIQASTNIPYFTPIDEEGGIVLRLSMGTRMTGNMAVGATGENAITNARTTGRVLGEECAALGFNVDYAPDVDVNSNPANPVIGTRSFSDDPAAVGPLATAYAEGLAQSNVIATYKHFPGHGDTGVDSHTGTPSVNKTYDQIKAGELVPFQHVIDNGADMIMTAHITFPLIDDAQTFGDGSTGYYPATMSKKMITDILRTDMGFSGVVVTDALEMDAIANAKLVEGEKGSVEYSANVAEKVINAGVDILLIPTDLKNADAAAFYDAYIDALIQKVEQGVVPETRINESVTRILNLKNKYGILDAITTSSNIDDVVATAKLTVGSDAHHTEEAAIAAQAITLVKNEGAALPISGYGSKVVILGRETADNVAIASAISQLQEAGVVDPDAYVNNISGGQTSGSADSSTQITIGHYYNVGTGKVDYPEEVKAAVLQADSVVCFSKMYGLAALQPSGVIYQGVSEVLADAHAAGAKFILLSGNLPYDAARYAEADAVSLAYMCSGTGIDPTDRTSASGTAGAYNANIIAGVESLFDNVAPSGKLPVNIPVMAAADDGTISYSEETLYPRGYGLAYQYLVTAGAGATHEGGSADSLAFTANGRRDKVARLLVDGATVDPASYTLSWGPTKIVLSPEYLNTLAAGDHTLSVVYDYGAGEFNADAAFATTAVPVEPVPEPAEPVDPKPADPVDPKPAEPADSQSSSSDNKKDQSSSDSSSASKQSSSAAQPANAADNRSSSSKTTSATHTLARTPDTAPVAPVALLALLALVAMALTVSPRPSE